MKSRRLIGIGVTIVVAALALGSCQLWKMVFGPDKNTITDWLPDWKTGSSLVYGATLYQPDGTKYANTTFKIEFVDRVESDAATTLTIHETWANGNTDDYYYIAHKSKGVFALSSNDYYDDSDQVLLKTPIEAGTSWYESFGSSAKYNIVEVKAVKTAGGTTYNDAVHVNVHVNTTLVAEFYYSPTGSLLSEKLIYSDGWYEEYVLQSITKA